ncbi:MAG: anhydro-N-acetylmuramic acid kinase [Terriglobales bacterium]
MIVAGVMSGTSADGINVALVELKDANPEAIRHGRSSSRTRRPRGQECPRYTLLAHDEFSFPSRVRRMILETMNAGLASVADLARLNFLLGELYANAVAKIARKHRIKIDLVGCHGQTIYHQGLAAPFLGHKIAVTWQTGEAAVIAARLGVPVVSDFRPADMAAGGKGAPLVPFLDYFLYRDARVGRIAQNIGGIANLTAIPAGANEQQLVAFDTGPGNMVIDAVMQMLFGKSYDRDGKTAASGKANADVIQKLMAAPFFRQRPPRTAGREEFGREYVGQFLRLCRGAGKADIVATATALTARSITDAIRRFVLADKSVRTTPTRINSKHQPYREMIVSGGGAKNGTLIVMLRDELELLDINLRFSDDFGIPAMAKEAVAFAVLAHETWHRRPSNVPAATGARRAVILGKVSYA